MRRTDEGGTGVRATRRTTGVEAARINAAEHIEFSSGKRMIEKGLDLSAASLTEGERRGNPETPFSV
ncbi:MAG: hypothetical protein WCC26_03350 [Terracidiphilus sp.]